MLSVLLPPPVQEWLSVVLLPLTMISTLYPSSSAVSVKVPSSNAAVASVVPASLAPVPCAEMVASVVSAATPFQ